MIDACKDCVHCHDRQDRWACLAPIPAVAELSFDSRGYQLDADWVGCVAKGEDIDCPARVAKEVDHLLDEAKSTRKCVYDGDHECNHEAKP